MWLSGVTILELLGSHICNRPGQSCSLGISGQGTLLQPECEHFLNLEENRS